MTQHTVRVTGQLWSCTCGAGGRQPDEQRARIAAQLHQATASRC